MKNISRWLKEGEQTKATARVLKIAKKIKGKEINSVVQILEWIQNNIKELRNINKGKKTELLRRRTADQIIKDGFSTGCGDYTLVFVALARAKKIPTKYVEAMSMKWKKGQSLQGHAWAEVFVDNKWIVVDPTMVSIHFKRRGKVPSSISGYRIFDKGLDAWDLGIKNFDNLKERFMKYKRR